jgi:hypothetical protein
MLRFAVCEERVPGLRAGGRTLLYGDQPSWLGVSRVGASMQGTGTVST